MKQISSYLILIVSLAGLQYPAQAETKSSTDTKVIGAPSCEYQAKIKQITDYRQKNDFIYQCESTRDKSIPIDTSLKDVPDS